MRDGDQQCAEWCSATRLWRHRLVRQHRPEVRMHDRVGLAEPSLHRVRHRWVARRERVH